MLVGLSKRGRPRTVIIGISAFVLLAIVAGLGYFLWPTKGASQQAHGPVASTST